MTCRRAYEIDIAAYLASPRGAEFADFRAHWPGCAECAAEVRAWTELAARLVAGAASAHPEPALLLRWDEAPDRLEPAQHAALRTHLAGCAACRDELAGLRTFEPTLAEARGAEAPGRARRRERGGFAAAVRALLWHPAFAYAAAFAVAGPLIYLQVTQERIDLRPQSKRAPAPSVARPAPAPAPAGARERAPEPQRASPADPAKKERELVAEIAPAPQPDRLPEAERSGAAAPQPKAPASAPPAPAPATEPIAEAPPVPSETLAPSEAPAPAFEAASGARQEAPAARPPPAGGVRRHVDLGRLRSLGYLSAEEGAGAPAARLELQSDGGGEFVSVPLDPEGGESSVRIERPDGAKSRVERYAAGASVAQLRLAEGWLGAGRHRIVVQSARGEREYYVER